MRMLGAAAVALLNAVALLLNAVLCRRMRAPSSCALWRADERAPRCCALWPAVKRGQRCCESWHAALLMRVACARPCCSPSRAVERAPCCCESWPAALLLSVPCRHACVALLRVMGGRRSRDALLRAVAHAAASRGASCCCASSRSHAKLLRVVSRVHCCDSWRVVLCCDAALCCYARCCESWRVTLLLRRRAATRRLTLRVVGGRCVAACRCACRALLPPVVCRRARTLLQVMARCRACLAAARRRVPLHERRVAARCRAHCHLPSH